MLSQTDLRKYNVKNVEINLSTIEVSDGSKYELLRIIADDLQFNLYSIANEKIIMRGSLSQTQNLEK